MSYDPANCYWQGIPGTYGSMRGALVSDPSTDGDLLAWVAAGNYIRPWPQDETGTVDATALDVLLAYYGLPPTGLASVSALRDQVITAAIAAAENISMQVFPDLTCQAGGQIAATVVANIGGAPPSGPFYTEFNAYADSWGMTPDDLAALIIVVGNQAMALSAAVNILRTAAAAATTSGQLATALSTFETAIGAVVTAINAANVPVAIVPPAAITIRGVN